MSHHSKQIIVLVHVLVHEVRGSLSFDALSHESSLQRVALFVTIMSMDCNGNRVAISGIIEQMLNIVTRLGRAGEQFESRTTYK
jgi:hypothetical protein